MKSKLLFPFLALIFLISCTPSSKKQIAENFTRVKMTKVDMITQSGVQNFAFISKPYTSALLSFRVSGFLQKFDAQTGNFYKKNQVIASLDPRDFIISKQNAQADYNRGQAEFKRVSALYKMKNISGSEYDKVKSDYLKAKANYDMCVNQLTDTKILAPFDGYVQDVYLECFQDVKASQAVISFIDNSRLKIEAYLPQNTAAQLKNLKGIKVYFDADPTKAYTAKFADISKTTSDNNLSFLLTAIFDNSKAKLLAGMSGQLQFDLPNQNMSIVRVPQIAVCHTIENGDFVWVLDSAAQTASMRKIVLGKLLDNGYITVQSGLSKDEIIATTGLSFLTPDCKIEIEN